MSPKWRQQWLHREGHVNGIHLHWVEAGHKGDPLVLLLHGFPEFWYSWRNQIPILRKEGFRVVVPDLRGYNLSEKPESGFDVETLTSDVLALIKVVGESKAHIVGHDWGAAIAWAFAARFPKHTCKLVILNAPPIQKLVEGFQGWQLVSSWYIFFFMLPGLPELVYGCNRGWLLTYSMGFLSKETDWFDEDTRELYRGAMSRPGALHCMLEYYRNLWKSAKQCKLYEEIRAPTLVLWGAHDGVFQPTMWQGLDDYVSEKLTFELLECGHCIQQEIPEEVNRRLIRFLR